ncbi:MAG: hypothetical protein DMG77_17665 [Acidobacteria bacterium]|nr:MAG: hypothetical protein DMG77_17665 [Acidobacteriota bacterium]
MVLRFLGEGHAGDARSERSRALDRSQDGIALPTVRRLVSLGIYFYGNAGNPVTGFVDPLGNAYSQWGSSDQTLEGFFDLAGLQFPDGTRGGQYQLSVEALDPLWAAGVEPYVQSQVVPSGTLAPIVVSLTAGGDIAQDLAMSRTAKPVPAWAASETWSAPAAIPAGGDWVGSLSGYGNVSYFSLPAQSNRTLSVSVTALDENGNAGIGKTQPVIGMWAASDPPGAPPPAFTPSSFNSAVFGETRLDARILTSTSFLVGSPICEGMVAPTITTTRMCFMPTECRRRASARVAARLQCRAWASRAGLTARYLGPTTCRGCVDLYLQANHDATLASWRGLHFCYGTLACNAICGAGKGPRIDDSTFGQGKRPSGHGSFALGHLRCVKRTFNNLHEGSITYR